MIESLTLTNFKAFKDAELDFTPITLLAGQNSSGKSTIIQSLLVLKQTLDSPMEYEPIILNGSYFSLGEFADVLNSSAKKNEAINFGIKIAPYSKGNTLLKKLPTTESNRMQTIDSINFNVDVVTSRNKGYEDDALLKITRSSFWGIVNDSPFSISFKRSRLTPSLLHEKFNLSKQNHSTRILEESTENQSLFTAENIWGIDWKPDIVKLKTFLPEFFFKAYVREIIDQQELFVKELVNLLNDVFGVNLTSDKDVPPKILIKLTIRALTPRTNDWKTSIDKQTANTFTRTVTWILNEMDFTEEDMKMIKRIFTKIPVEFSDKVESFLSSTEEKIKETRKLKKSLELCNTHELGIEAGDIFFDFDDVNTFITNKFNKLYYLGPLRTEPTVFYRRTGSVDPMYVGQKGENVAFVLKYYSSKKILAILPPKEGEFDPSTSSVSNVELGTAVQHWLKYLGVATNITVEEIGNFGLTIRANIHGNKEAYLTNVGVGVSQILPIIVMGIASPNGATLVVEQPELHLHPYIQSRLGDFFVALASLNKQVIAETHSEHLIHRLRYHIAKGNLSNEDDVSVYFTYQDSNDKLSDITRVSIDKFGSIESWPKGFFDETNKQLEDILFAALNREDLIK